MIDFEEILTLTFLFLPTSFFIDWKSLPKVRASDEWVKVEWLSETRNVTKG